jgi:hypothetical protein
MPETAAFSRRATFLAILRKVEEQSLPLISPVDRRFVFLLYPTELHKRFFIGRIHYRR